MSDNSQIEQLISEARMKTSPELDERVLRDVSAGLTGASDRVSPPTPSSRATGWKRVAPSLAAAVILLLAGLWWTSRPDELWAQVVKQVQAKPWMVMRGKAPEGDVEMWFSIPHQTSASKSPDHVMLTRIKDAVLESYSPQTNQIIRQTVAPESSTQRGYDAFATLFEGLFSGDEHLDLDTAFGRIPNIGKIEQSRTEIKDGKETWYDYRITLQAEGEEPATLTIRVNAETALMTQMTVANPGRPEVTVSIEYPETGPTSIYDLGVPRDAEVVDATPQGLEGPAKEIVSQMRSAAEKFGDYRAIIVSSNPDDSWHVGSPIVVWKKGLRMRMDAGFVDPANPPAQSEPDAQTDHRQWWRDRCRELWFRPVEYHDGESIFSNQFIPDTEQTWSFNTHPRTAPQTEWGQVEWKQFGPVQQDWPARTIPVIWAYSDLSGYFANAYLYDISLTRERAADGRETTLVKVTWPSGDTHSDVEYVLDPSRDYVVLRYSSAVHTMQDGVRTEEIQSSRVHENFQQTPSGTWYATTITDVQSIRQGDDVTEGTTVSRYDLQFDVELPDALFAAPKTSQVGIPR